MTAYLLTRRMGADLREKMEEHYKTFIVGIPVVVACGPADARLSRTLPRSLGRVSTGSGELTTAATTWVSLTRRIPIGYWAIETLPEEPFLEGVSWA